MQLSGIEQSIRAKVEDESRKEEGKMQIVLYSFSCHSGVRSKQVLNARVSITSRNLQADAEG